MTKQKQKSLTVAGSGNSNNIHQDIANNQYFNMILNNEECAKFCCELLEQFDDLLNQYCPDNPSAFKGNELRAFISLCNLQKHYEQRSH